MSIYVALDGELQSELASNRGWSDFCRWCDKLNATKYAEVRHLAEHGWCQSLPDLDSMLRKLLSKIPGDIRPVAESLLAFIANTDAEVLTITDGLGEDQPPAHEVATDASGGEGREAGVTGPS